MSQPGLELLYESVSQQLKCPDDAVMCVLHWNIISSGFKCTGIGECFKQDQSGQASGQCKKTERLPQGWNGDSSLYVLRYQHTGSQEQFVLKVIKIDNSLLVHFMRSKDEKVTSMNIRVANYTTGELAEFESAFKSLGELENRIKCDILKDFSKDSKETSSSTSANTSAKSRQGRQPMYEDDPLRVPTHRQPPPPDWMPSSDPFAVGRGDLDPLAGGMGGMLMDPRRSGGRGLGPDPNAGLPERLPPGAVPPGARFDPFGPPGRPGPDPDHLPPPGYDDMFM